LSGKVSQIHLSLNFNNSHMFSTDNFRLFITLLYSLMGMEMIAVHAGDVRNPQKDYPKALAIAAVIILATVIPSSLAIAIVIPAKEIGLTTGLNDAFITLLNAFNLGWLKPFIIIAIAIGSFGIFYNWLLVPARCLLVAAKDNDFPSLLQQTNQENMPVAQMLTQGVIFTLVCTVFIYMPSVNSAFWLLTAACAQLALVYYLFLFGAALRLRYVKPNIQRPFKVGKHPLTIWVVCCLAMITCIVAIGFGFLPPADIDSQHLFFYETFLFTLMFGSCGVGIFIFKLCHMIKAKSETKVNCELTV
jgi:amino acid transporter